jgi:hypothetical protein
MEYFFIYSAGGGAGDWNGLKRVWNQRMPTILKRKILLKFGDAFYNHASSRNLIKPVLWRNIVNMRTWISESVNDNFVQRESNILLDSGTSKIVNHIITNHYEYSSEEIVEKFIELVREKNIMQKYIDIINESDIQEAVTFDIPNPFKIRTQSQNTRTRVFDSNDSELLIRTSANFANEMFHLMEDNQDKILTTINGIWSDEEINLFLSLLEYVPNKLAIGGLTRSFREISQIITRLNRKLNFASYGRIHFLGCGGIKMASKIKELIPQNDSFSVDNSTPWNRAIDGNTSGTSQSGYFDYSSKNMVRITPSNKDDIIGLHTEANSPVFTVEEMKDIINSVLNHQSNNSGLVTYEARALLAIHNHDVFRVNAK